MAAHKLLMLTIKGRRLNFIQSSPDEKLRTPFPPPLRSILITLGRRRAGIAAVGDERAKRRVQGKGEGAGELKRFLHKRGGKSSIHGMRGFFDTTSDPVLKQN